jgi:hypothetical protein
MPAKEFSPLARFPKKHSLAKNAKNAKVPVTISFAAFAPVARPK